MRSIRWKLTISYLLTALVAVFGLGLYLSHWTANHYISLLREQLSGESRFIGRLIEERPGDPEGLAKEFAGEIGRRVTIIGADGRVIGDSERDPRSMENHLNRPEVRRALADGEGWSIRYSDTLRTRMLYVAVRLGDGKGVARLATGLQNVDKERGKIHRVFFIAAFVVFALAALVGARISSGITRPLASMRAVARRFGSGDFSASVQTDEGGEIGELAHALNRMASELRSTISELAEEKAKLEAVFTQSDDGLLVTDERGAIRMMNPAACRMLGVRFEDAEGKTVIEGTLNHELADLAERVLRTKTPASLEVSPQEAHIYACVTPLATPDGLAGAALVMHDLTAARRIDSVRRDFVANVSHELRNPLASIRAMAETILLRGEKDPRTAAEFAQKIVGEADRLTALSEDLLDLAAIEAGRREIRRESFALAGTAEKVAAEFAALAETRAIALHNRITAEHRVHADPEAVHQILANLVDNALKYTRPGGSVEIGAEQDGKWVSLCVTDTGIGIPEDDLGRIFERFYRVDKARSRASGGTGLGLSIVKHLVEAHGGTISVESRLHHGSTFTVMLPVRP
ncbi:MAG: HAMP domain-containing sensor histidine kinase [Armatimonadota bacterium]